MCTFCVISQNNLIKILECPQSCIPTHVLKTHIVLQSCNGSYSVNHSENKTQGSYTGMEFETSQLTDVIPLGQQGYRELIQSIRKLYRVTQVLKKVMFNSQSSSTINKTNFMDYGTWTEAAFRKDSPIIPILNLSNPVSYTDTQFYQDPFLFCPPITIRTFQRFFPCRLTF